MNNLLHRGLSLTVTAPYALLSGGGAKVGSIFGIACFDAPISTSVELQTEGVVALAKDSSVFSQGDLVYWNDTTKLATSVAGSNLHIGQVEVAALTGDATVALKLRGLPGIPGIRMARFVFDFAVDGGAIGAITPSVSDSIPANALVFGNVINSVTAVTSAGSATVSFGTTAGSSAASLLAATAKTSFTLDAVLAGLANTAPFKMSAAGQINLTVAVAALTAGKIEGFVFYTLGSFA